MIIFHAIEGIEDPSVPLIGLMEAQQLPVRTIVPYTLFGMRVVGGYLSALFPDEEYIPREALLNDTESTFDYFYWEQLMKKTESFMAMTELLNTEFMFGPSVMIMIQVENTPYRMSITESIKNYMNSMYGLDPRIVFDFEDLCDPSLYEYYSGFSPEGAARMSRDVERYAQLVGWGDNYDQSMG